MANSGYVASGSCITFESEGGRGAVQFGVDARLDGSSVSAWTARDLPNESADLLEIAAAIYALDRMIRRNPAAQYEHWSRRIAATIPVREPERWKSVAVALEQFLTWLTDDVWQLDFVGAERPGLRTGQGYLFGMLAPNSEPALFSGGLDSAAGLARFRANSHLVPVSVVTNNHMLGVQRAIIKKLDRVAHRTPHVRIRIELDASAMANRGLRHQERSQRSRGFLFLAAGVASSLAMGSRCLWFFENGIGAINLPYIRAQIGAQATKSAHPKTIKLMEEIIQSVTDGPFEIKAPFVGSTKAEVFSAVAVIDAAAVATSVSCDTSFSSRIAGHPACGCCTSCILRMQSVLASRYPDADRGILMRRTPGRTTKELSAMLWQASRMESALSSSDQLARIRLEFPDLVHCDGYLQSTEIVRLISAYVEEWTSLLRVLEVPTANWFSDNYRTRHDLS